MPRSAKASRWAVVVITGLVQAFSTAASAQPGPFPVGLGEHRPTAVEPPKPARPADLRGLFGVPVALGLVASEDPEARLRGLVRLGAIGSAEAIDALIGALDQGSALIRDPRARLVGVRVLAPFAKRDPVRAILVREMTDPSPEGRGVASPLAAIVRDTAALALARVEDKKATLALVAALRQGGPVADAAARALRAHPPASLESLVGVAGREALAPAIAALLGDLGDLRSIPRLRELLQQPDAAKKIAAAVALAKLGDGTPIPVATAWMGRDDPALQRGAAEVLATLGAPAARAAIEKLLASDSLVADGVRFALMDPAPGLDAALAAALAKLPTDARELRAQCVAAMGRAAEGPGRLEALLADPDPELATSAALALARLPGAPARAALATRLAAARGKEGAPRRLLARAGIVRALVLADAPEGLVADLEAMLSTKDASDRAVGAFGLVALGQRDAAGLLASKDDAVAIAAARGLLARGDREASAASVLLGDTARGTRAIAAGVALLARPDAPGISTSALASWAEAGGPLAPLAARALPSRDDEGSRGRIKRLLAGTDPVVRAHVALGLGRDPEPDAVALLASAYAFEEDVGVRRAVVRALSRRTELQRRPTLALASELDPDPGVRALARSALDGRVLDPPPRGPAAPADAVAWIVVTPRGDAARARPASARLVRADGLAVPAVADPDGVLLVPGLPPGPASLLLAPPSDSGDAGDR